MGHPRRRNERASQAEERATPAGRASEADLSVVRERATRLETELLVAYEGAAKAEAELVKDLERASLSGAELLETRERAH